MSDFIAASRYAKSILKLSQEQGVTEEVYKDMVLIDEVVDQNRELALLLKSPIINHYKKEQVLDAIFSGKVHSLTEAFFKLIVRKGREFIFHDITIQFRKQYLILKGIEKVSVTTTFPLDKDLRSQIKELAKSISGKEPELEEKVDDNIIGGFVLNLESKRIDASVKAKLKKLEQELTN
jgi:F-type H+-transporting ATPase subunit delta